MRKVLWLLFSSLTLHASAQQVALSGSVIDTSENESLANAVICLIRQTDSVLVSFTRSAADGSFSFTEVPPQRYHLLVTYPGYADYTDFFEAGSGKNSDLGKIILTRKADLLEAVVVRRQLAAMHMKGDTLVYKADSFAVREGATVEELLKQLPGIQVDRNGVITAQGKQVEKLLVDGEEFFSDDPAVVTQNLGAHVVKDVEVFDKKSEQADFTGIDDGQRTKTINLTLKPEMKKGYFGKATVSGGTRETYNNDLMLNKFKGSQKMSAFGIMSNTGRAGLSWQENRQFGAGDNMNYDEESGNFFIMGGDEFSYELSRDEGLPSTWTGGLHFSDKWDADKKHINANYRGLKRNLRSESTDISQYILPDTQYFNTRVQQAYSTRIRNNLSGFYDIKLDSLSSLKINVSGDMGSGDTYSFQSSRALNADSGLVNNNERLLSSNNHSKNFRTNVLWRKKFRVPGRTLSLNLSGNYNDQSLDGFMQSKTDFYNQGGLIDSVENIDQQKINNNSSTGIQGSAVYTEPLSTTTFLSFNYNFRMSDNDASRNSFNKTEANGKYEERDSLLSNDFRFLYNTHGGGVDLKINKKKWMATIGSGASISSFLQTDYINDVETDYSFVNFFPKAIIQWKPGQSRQLQLHYSGRTAQPTLEQLQPVRENTDPLNLKLGNPDLRQQFVHSVNLSLYNYKPLGSTGYNVYTYSNFTQNAITNAITVDPGGKTTSQFVNMDGNYNIGGGAYFNTALKPIKLQIGTGVNFNTGRSVNILNGLENINNNQSYSARLHLTKYEEKKYSMTLAPSLSYVYSKSSLRPDVVTQYFSSSSEISAWVVLPHKFEFYTSANINLRQKTDVFDRNMNVVNIYASLTRRVFKKNNGELKIACYDLLDQNIGFNRSATSNFISEHSYNSLRRYFMLSFVYNISKTP